MVGQERFGRISPLIGAPLDCSKICHSYEAFTYLFGQNIFMSLPSANKDYLVNLLKINNHGLSGIKRECQKQR